MVSQGSLTCSYNPGRHPRTVQVTCVDELGNVAGFVVGRSKTCPLVGTYDPKTNCYTSFVCGKVSWPASACVPIPDR